MYMYIKTAFMKISHKNFILITQKMWFAYKRITIKKLKIVNMMLQVLQNNYNYYN